MRGPAISSLHLRSYSVTRLPERLSRSTPQRPDLPSVTALRSTRRGGAGIARDAAEGRANLCENIYFMGSASRTPHMQGGFASVFDATPAQCVKVPPHVAYQAAALAEPLAVSLHAVARAGAIADRSVIVFGAGPIGLLTMLAARLKGCGGITIADIATAPLAFATQLGADQRRSIFPAAMPNSRRLPPPDNSMLLSKFQAPRPASPRRSPASGAVASSSRSAISRAARSRYRPTPSWPKRST